MRSIVIVGAGELGGALARQLAATDVSLRITLVDEAATVAQGKALDIMQSAPVDRYSTWIGGTADESVAVDADAIVIADRHGATSSEWQDAPAIALVRRLARLNEQAFLLCAGARQLDLVEQGVREAGVSPQRLFGSAPEALRSAVMSIAALEARCNPTDISLTVVGRPANQIIVPWDDAAIAGRRATEVLTPPAITRLDARLPRLWPPGPLTLAGAATRFLVAAETRTQQALSAFVIDDRPVRGRVGMLPVTMSGRGIASVIAPSLSTRDRVRLDTALSR